MVTAFAEPQVMIMGVSAGAFLLIVPAVGEIAVTAGFTVTSQAAVLSPSVVVAVIVASPTATGVTRPVKLTVATAGLLLL